MGGARRALYDLCSSTFSHSDDSRSRRLLDRSSDVVMATGGRRRSYTHTHTHTFRLVSQRCVRGSRLIGCQRPSSASRDLCGVDDPSRNHLSFKHSKCRKKHVTVIDCCTGAGWVATASSSSHVLLTSAEATTRHRNVKFSGFDWRLKVYTEPQRYHNFTCNCNAVVYNLRAMQWALYPFLAVIWSVWVCWVSRRNSLLLPVTTVYTIHKTFWYFTWENTQTEQTFVVGKS